jgi:hypothetical protein
MDKLKPAHVFNDKTLSLDKLIEFRKQIDNNMDTLNTSPLWVKFMKNPPYDMCLEAVQKRPSTIQYIPEDIQTEELCLEVVRNAPAMFRFCHIQTERVSRIAIDGDWTNLQYIKGEDQTIRLCLSAFRQSPRAILYMRNFTEDIERIIRNEILYKKLEAV